MVVFTLGGIIHRVILDSSTVVTTTGADLWVVQEGWLGPFVEVSRLPEDYYYAVESMHGSAEASPLVMTTCGLNVMRLLRKVSTEQDTAILVVTHDERMIGEVGRVIQLLDGRVVSNESTSNSGNLPSKKETKAS
jgi:hypothetical protein